ncbi:MAG: WD40 repeat domain-containing protein, partial [Planctomycetota bacterium]
SFVTSALFSPDSQAIVTASQDGTAKIWPMDFLALAGKHRPRDLTIEEKQKFNIWEPGEQEAFDWVKSLFGELVFSQDVLECILADTKHKEKVREAAMCIAHATKEDPFQLNGLSWDIVKSPLHDTAQFRTALRRSEAASRLGGDHLVIINTLGIAQYRAGLYEETLSTFQRARNLEQDETQERDPYRLAFTAMAQFKLDRREEALSTLDRLRAITAEPGHGDNQQCMAFLQEAEELLSGK